jgi:hypothetical protein
MAPVSEWSRENRLPSCYAATGGLFQKNLFLRAGGRRHSATFL